MSDLPGFDHWWQDRCSAAGLTRVFCWLDRWHDEVTEVDPEDGESYTYLVGKPWARWLCWLHAWTVNAECYVRFAAEDLRGRLRA